ncbi:hypothetical protein OA950_02080, partial [Candidatus Pelagibacter sp.]|nr:hypothetical protein [Candidatus Pelagibacter sp.]
SNEIIVDDIFKYWAIYQKKKKSKIVLFEHGLNYNIVNKYYPQNPRLEESYVDKIFTWGNVLKDKKYKPLFSIPKHKFSVKNKSKLILIYNQCAPNYSHLPNEYYFNRFNFKIFYKNLSNKIKKKILIRLHRTNFLPLNNSKIKEKLKYESKNKNLDIENGSINLNKLISKSNLLVFSYPSTGFFEAILSDIPCILFWKDFSFEIHKLSKASFKKLEKIGILFSDEIKLSQSINKIYYNTDEWWYDKHRRKQLINFKRKYLIKNSNLNKVYLELTKFL